jgi:hypothetical protein
MLGKSSERFLPMAKDKQYFVFRTTDQTTPEDIQNFEQLIKEDHMQAVALLVPKLRKAIAPCIKGVRPGIVVDALSQLVDEVDASRPAYLKQMAEDVKHLQVPQ